MFPANSKMLIIDDEPVMRALLRDELSREGFNDLSEAVDGEDGLAQMTLAAESNDPFLVVIIDWNMPKMSGLEMLQKALENPKIKDNAVFIFVTSQSDAASVYQAILLGVSSYITKPIVKGVLREKLATVWKAKQKAKSS